MNPVHIRLMKIYNGPPDLTVSVVPEKSMIQGGAVPGGPQDSSLVTITVQNRWTFYPGPIVMEEPNTIPVFGSDAKNVTLAISLSPGLHQVGNITAPAGFIAAITPNGQTIYLFGGTILAGDWADFAIEVIGDTNCGSFLPILVEVDPFSTITEVSKSNNKASATILVQNLC